MIETDKKKLMFYDPVEEGCPGCGGQMGLIPGQKKDAWKCEDCKLEIWTGDMPTYMELHEMIHSDAKEVFYSTIREVKNHGGKKRSSGGGRKRKKPKKYYRPGYFDY